MHEIHGERIRHREVGVDVVEKGGLVQGELKLRGLKAVLF